MHDAVELVRAVAWPLVVLFFLLFYRKEIRRLLNEMPSAMRRVRSARVLGVDVKFDLDKIEAGLPAAEEEAKNLILEMPTAPTPKQLTGQGEI